MLSISSQHRGSRLSFASATAAMLTAAVFGLATAASAADLPARVYTKAPPIVAAVYDWTGFYIGGNVGYSWGRERDDSTLTNTAGTVLFASSGRSDLDGVVGGGQLG